MSTPTIYELNRMVSAWDERNRVSRNKSGHGVCPYIKAEGGTWLASMATLIGASVKTIKINETPRPAVKYRGVWFVNFEVRGAGMRLEAWELACATREYNREKQRLKRLREIASADM